MNDKNQPPHQIRKRVLFVITQSEFGGAQRFLFDCATHLNPEKFEPILAVGRDGDGELLVALQGQLPIHRLSQMRREISPRNDLAAMGELRQLIKTISPDILFLNSSKAGFLGSLAAVWPRRRSRPRVIYRIGGWTFNDPWPNWKKRLWIILERWSAHWKDVIIVNNQRDYAQAQSLSIRPRESVVLIHNGLDLSKINFLPREEARLKLFEKITQFSGKTFPTLEKRDSTKIIGTIANFYPPKGLPHLMAAAERFIPHPEVIFLVLGEGAERPALERLIAEKKLDQKVFLLGRVPQARDFLPAFDIFVLPSLKEGFPWAVLEAMAAKVPVIATDTGAVPEIIDHGKNGLVVKPGHPQAIADGLSELLANDHLRQTLGLHGHQTVLSKFGLDKMIKQIETIL